MTFHHQPFLIAFVHKKLDGFMKKVQINALSSIDFQIGNFEITRLHKEAFVDSSLKTHLKTSKMIFYIVLN